MYKKVKVVMLATPDKSFNTKVPVIKHTDGTLQYLNMDFANNSWVGQHLYFLSDEIGDVDNINAGEWALNPNERPNIFGYDWQARYSKEEILKCRKIIASTDESLNVPRIPNDFTKKYIDAYNANQPIENVDIEYDMVNINHGTNFAHKYVEELKVEWKSNTVNIKTEQETWNREDLIRLAIYFKAVGGNERDNCWLSHHNDMFNDWILENS